MAELPVSETMPPPTPKKEDQDHELQQMSPTPRMLEQATAYLEAQGSKAGNVTTTDLGADTLPLCLAVANCSVNVTPVNSMSPNPSWCPCQTPSQSRGESPRNYEGARSSRSRCSRQGSGGCLIAQWWWSHCGTKLGPSSGSWVCGSACRMIRAS